jgi:hypothetical protein
MNLEEKKDIEIMVMLAEMEQAKQQLNQQLAAVQNEWMRRVQEEKEKGNEKTFHITPKL